ncbi:MAG TPA: hypothetical protein VNA17_07690 [Pyrinomonadaceae bacterium]|nr:hypothetical protein [Pyrinomonadaceae bacterium]
MMTRTSPTDVGFQQLLERSDEVFHEFRRLAASSKPDLKILAQLASEGEKIAAEMVLIVRAKRKPRRHPRSPA